jgi:hypothetical protein
VDAVLQMLSCKCKHCCKLPECTSLSNGLKCTDMCKLQTCSNQLSDNYEDDVSADLEDSDVTDEDDDNYGIVRNN